MRDMLIMVAAAAIGALLVCVPGAFVLRALHRKSITLNICVLLAITVLAVVAGVVAVAEEMFISEHDLKVLLIVVPMSGGISLIMAWWLGRRLARAAMWERQAEEQRRDLIAWVSHDLRTPLAGMRAMAEALEDGVVSDPATVAEYHRRMRTSTDQMASLVDDLFELSRINAGALHLRPVDLPLSEIVSEAIATVSPSINVRVENLPVVRASEPELFRIVANLLLNAVRYTPADGTVTVTGGKSAQGSWFAVSDTCGGIPAADLPRVFDVAFRGETARSGPGGGLGLAIVRGLVEAHGGRVTAGNTGPGCEFVVRLPA